MLVTMEFFCALENLTYLPLQGMKDPLEEEWFFLLE